MDSDIIEATIAKDVIRLKDENTVLRAWAKPNDTPTCVVCGKPIRNISVQRMLRPYKWHSRACFQLKPGKIVDLERVYGLDIVDILKETTRRYGTIQTQGEALGVSPPYLYAIMRKYLPDWVEFMAQYATGKRRAWYANKVRNNLFRESAAAN